MTSNAELVTTLIQQQQQQQQQQQNTSTEPAEAIAAVIQHEVDSENNDNKEDASEQSHAGEGAQEYVYWARRGEFETAGEVEVSSSNGANEEVQEEVVAQEAGEFLIVEESVPTGTEVSTTRDDAVDLVYGLQAAAEQLNAVNALQNGVSEELLEQQRRLEAKREASKVQEKIMNEEYQKAIGYLLCSSKSKSGKQKKKQTMTAYLFFCRRYRSKIVARNPKLSFAQISKLLSHMWRNASEQEKNTYRLKLEQHRTKVNAIVEKNMIEKMKMVKQQKLMEEIQRRNDEEHEIIASTSSSHELHSQQHDYGIPTENNENEHVDAAISEVHNEIHTVTEEVTTTINNDDESYNDDENSSELQNEEISHAVIDPTTKTMLLEAEC